MQSKDPNEATLQDRLREAGRMARPVVQADYTQIRLYDEAADALDAKAERLGRAQEVIDAFKARQEEWVRESAEQQRESERLRAKLPNEVALELANIWGLDHVDIKEIEAAVTRCIGIVKGDKS